MLRRRLGAVLAVARAVHLAHLDLEEIARRVALGHDFRGLPIVTIDGETARDFDDAVYAQEHADGEARGGFTHHGTGLS